jgi:hypothetical protein
MARHDSNTIIKFADDTTLVSLITDNDETAYREEVRDLAVWCQNKNLSLKVTKTKEMIVDYRKRRTEHATILIDGAVVDQASQQFLPPSHKTPEQVIKWLPGRSALCPAHQPLFYATAPLCSSYMHSHFNHIYILPQSA